MDGSARLTDFGVARATSSLSTTRTGQLKGKLAYTAPEQARAAKDIDRRADVFAAGVGRRGLSHRTSIEHSLDAGTYWVIVDGQSPNDRGAVHGRVPGPPLSLDRTRLAAAKALSRRCDEALAGEPFDEVDRVGDGQTRARKQMASIGRLRRRCVRAAFRASGARSNHSRSSRNGRSSWMVVASKGRNTSIVPLASSGASEGVASGTGQRHALGLVRKFRRIERWSLPLSPRCRSRRAATLARMNLDLQGRSRGRQP